MINISDFKINAGVLIRYFRLRYSIINDNVYLGFIDIDDVKVLKSFSHVNTFLVTNLELGIISEQFRFVFSEENLLKNSRMYWGNFNTLTELNDNADWSLSFDELISIKIMDLL